ncbi:hypothetical protein MYP_1048 [Sporocytophaga myxococcoides]|uniref:Acyl esterase n=1 Tax=Sporocytophaga myxococcoides TaxID=153721 RepID=A0A098LAA3_9BACT|nr:hypothetical protein [Sporocytophaga myxococcoides]GAL83820.1 hypothetical protein MYP_1048 [Sporocytophaga myxococcoides]
MQSTPKEISEVPFQHPIKFTVGTLVTNKQEYQVMLDSFARAGFNGSNTEFLFCDNSSSNRFDAYSGYNEILSKARGQYIILCHQDIELNYDNISILEERICAVELLDKNWAVLGNAGGLHLKMVFERVTYPDKEIIRGPFPSKVNTLDENFLLINARSRISFSVDLKGYHFYGTDICLIAQAMGYSCWVIDFNLLHKSSGNMNEDFFEKRTAFIEKYAKAYRWRYLRTTCTTFYIASNVVVAKMISTSFFKFLFKLPLKIRRKFKGDYLFDE